MALFDKFKKPKQEDDDSDVREKAVLELDDPEILTEIAKNDDASFVRKKSR